MLIDLDDTILSGGQRSQVLLQVALELATELTPHTPDAVARYLEVALTLFWSDPARHKVARFGLTEARRQVIGETFEALTPPLSQTCADRFAGRFSAVREDIACVFPGALEGLHALRGAGVRLALITNGSSDVQRAKIARFALAAYFDHIQIEGEVGFGKPEEQAYRHAMAALGSEPHDTWIVGDNLEWEVAAPQRLGLYGVWCDGFGLGLPAGTTVKPDRIIRTLGDLIG